MNAPLKPDAFRVAAEIEPLAEPVIRFERVGKVFAGRRGQQPVTALEGIDLAVPRGAIVGVIGRSGAGKSTLIRLVNGLEQASSGRILIEDEDVTALSEAGWRTRRRATGMIFQHFNLLSSRTVFDNVALPLEIAGTPKSEIKTRVEKLLDLVGLADKRERYPAELSGGQKQRVGIARALATEPKVLLCDEATSALDPETTQSILALLRKVNRELGVTILLITHEIPVIKEICDRVAVIEGGRIVEEGETFEIFTAPRHPTTARFVEAVTGVELPAHLAGQLREVPQAGGSAVLRVTFSGANATAPVISRLSAVLGVDVNILAGRIDAIAGKPFGSLLISVPSDEPGFGAVLGALKSLELKAEVIGHVA
ncbi:methionine ABC transporter ATP-binding protein [Bosea sp. (in: a-proteobacteria)]|uniref:methionine ABC transporter ATP-binding protein n=1 Tax=Bosea sp. (in: a-proteobacteria) TaxID=1871050 RepID=UPI002FC9999C